MDEWYLKLQGLLKQAVKDNSSNEWLNENNYISPEIREAEIEGKFKVERFERTEEELRIYASIGESIIYLYDVQLVIYEVLRVVSEGFLVLVPLHTPQEFQFWFITGSKSHGHIAKIIIERDKHPQIQEYFDA